MHGKLLKYIFIFLILFIPLGEKISAQEEISIGFSVSPQIFELDVFPGETIYQKINISNKSNVPVPIEVKFTDFTAAENSGDMLFDESLQDPSIAARKWFEIKNPNFILALQERENIDLTIEVPENAEPGGHYVTMLFEPRLPSYYFQEGQTRSIPVIGILFLLSVKTFSLEPENQEKIEIVEFSIPKEERMVVLENFISRTLGTIVQAAEIDINIVESSPSNFILRIKNNDIYHHRPEGKLVIYNSFGKKVTEVQIPKTTILPGKVRQFPVKIPAEASEKLKWLPGPIYNLFIKNISLGKYTASIILEIPEQKLEIENYFWGFSRKIFLLLVFLMVVSVLMRKRIIPAFKVLVFHKYYREQ